MTDLDATVTLLFGFPGSNTEYFLQGGGNRNIDRMTNLFFHSQGTLHHLRKLIQVGGS